MSYKVTINNRQFDLPKCTLSIEEKAETMRDTEKEVVSGKTRKRALVEQQLDFLESLLGEEQSKEALSYTSIEDVDTKELEIAVYRIMNAYTASTTAEKMKDAQKTATDAQRTLGMSLQDAIRIASVKK